MRLVVLKMHELGTVFNDDFVKVKRYISATIYIRFLHACQINSRNLLPHPFCTHAECNFDVKNHSAGCIQDLVVPRGKTYHNSNTENTFNAKF